jgi:POT family proton-dependent oligopeptide transporter
LVSFGAWAYGKYLIIGITGSELEFHGFKGMNIFIISRSSFSKFWEKRRNPSGPVKFALGLILVGIGFAALACGERDSSRSKDSVCEYDLVGDRLIFHSAGELCLSPVGLSYVIVSFPQRNF